MRNLRQLDRYRDKSVEVLEMFGTVGDGTCGVFHVPSPVDRAWKLMAIAASGEGWDHVSVSMPTRCPTWAEMEHVKRLFFEDGETAMQLHVPPGDHVDYHPYTLHLWRPLKGEIPRPPGIMVGPRARRP